MIEFEQGHAHVSVMFALGAAGHFAGSLSLAATRDELVPLQTALSAGVTVGEVYGQSRVDWAAIAAKHGYADQPHLADEFRDLAGVTPNQYLRSRINGSNHLRPAHPA